LIRNERPVFEVLDPVSARQVINRHARMVVNHLLDVQFGRFSRRRADKIIQNLSQAVYSLEWWFIPGQGVAQVILNDLWSGDCSFDAGKSRLSYFIELAMCGDKLDIYKKEKTEKGHKERVWHHQEAINRQRSCSGDDVRLADFFATLPDHLRNGLQQPVVQARLRFRGIDTGTAMLILEAGLKNIPQTVTANELGIHDSTFSKTKEFLFRLLADYPSWVPADLAEVFGLAQ
jgi:hypothetical protein